MRHPLVTLCLIAFLALPALGTPAPTAASGTTVTRVAVKDFPGTLQVAIHATGPISYQASLMDQPDRLVIDIPGARDGVDAAVVPVNKDPVRQVRISQFVAAPPITRVVIDLLRPVRYDVVQAGANVVAARLATSAGAPAAPAGAPPAAAKAPAAPVVAGMGITVVSQGTPQQAQKLNLDLRDASLSDVLDALARICGLNLVTDSSVQGKVTIHLVGVTCEEAFRFLLEANNLGFRRVGDTLIVEAASKLTPPPPGPVTRVYHLQYLQPPISTPEPLVGSVGSTSTGGSSVSGGAGPVKKDVASVLDLFKATGATLSYDDRTNSLVVTGTPTQQDAVQALLQQLDVPVAQVSVQALVVDITSTSLRDLGIEWSVLQGSSGTPFTFQEVGPLPPGQLGVNPVTRDLLLARIHAFIQQGTAKVLSDPRVSTFDGQQALIFAGDQIPIVNTTTAGNPPVTTETVTFQPIGVTLKITPKINADRTISTQIHPVVTTATSFTAPTSTNPNGLPLISIREAVTNLRVSDGSSVILGGLMKYSDVRNIKKIPLLGDLPFIGSLFRLSTVNHSESEVIIIMTPRIISTGAPA